MSLRSLSMSSFASSSVRRNGLQFRSLSSSALSRYKVDNPTVLVLGGNSVLGKSIISNFRGFNRISVDFKANTDADFNVEVTAKSWSDAAETVSTKVAALLKDLTPK